MAKSSMRDIVMKIKAKKIFFNLPHSSGVVTTVGALNGFSIEHLTL